MLLQNSGDLKLFKHLHFIGIGGSGMYPLAEILIAMGHVVSGSDRDSNDNTKHAQQLGMKVFLGHSPDHIGECDAVVYTAAVASDNIELSQARRRGIPVFERSVVLGYLTKLFSNCICVAGTHGKTTSTAMLAHIILASQYDPTIYIGGKLDIINGGGRLGSSEIMIAEACEFSDTFLHMAPDIAIVLNIDDDHLDYFKTSENMLLSYRRFLASCSKCMIINGDDGRCKEAAHGLKTASCTFGIKKTNDYFPENINWNGGCDCVFDLNCHNMLIESITLHVPGYHNVMNAVAASAGALESGIPADAIKKGLNNFRGVHRRFEIIYKDERLTIIDDYAHHPAEIRSVLSLVKKMNYKRVWAVFQPFTYSRTAFLLDDFAHALQIADRVVMSPIMGAREVNTYNISTADLADKVPGSRHFESFNEICRFVLNHATPGDVVITLGCGDIYRCARMMAEILSQT
jgi:UDP-N-acetylmuramate--alanine ligase